MSANILSRTISASNQNAISLSNSAFARLIPIPTGWTNLRFGMRYHFTQGSFSSPTWAFGFCHGQTGLVNAGSTGHFVGVVSNTGFTSNGTTPGSVYFNVAVKPFVKIGASSTFGTNIAGDTRHGNTAEQNSADRTVIYLDIVKGSPNYTMNLWFFFGGTAHDWSRAEFNSMLGEATPSYDGGAFLNNGTAQTIAVDEGANGILNALSVWWNQSGVTLEICDWGWAVLG